MSELILFDYQSLDTETRIVVRQRTGEIKTLVKRTAGDIVEIGEKLIEVKGRLAHGQFTGWLEQEFDWTDRTARNFMRVAETFKTENFSDLEIAPSAMYLLAAGPDDARAEAIVRARAGERITRARAREIVAEHKTENFSDLEPGQKTVLENSVPAVYLQPVETIEAERYRVIIEPDAGVAPWEIEPAHVVPPTSAPPRPSALVVTVSVTVEGQAAITAMRGINLVDTATATRETVGVIIQELVNQHAPRPAAVVIGADIPTAAPGWLAGK